MNKPFGYFGGKDRSALFLKEKIPYHTIYIEVFGGGASLLFKKNRSFREIYNDYNFELYNFFMILRDNPEELQELIDKTPIGRGIFEYEVLQSNMKSCIDVLILKAALFFMRRIYSFGGKGEHFSFNNKAGNKIYRPDIIKFSERMQNVIIENLEFDRLIKKYDKDTTLFYLDPPYYPTETEKYGSIYGCPEWDQDDIHFCLYNVLKNIKGKFMLSYNSVTYIRELYKDFNIIEFSFKKAYQNTDERSKEVLICNF